MTTTVPSCEMGTIPPGGSLKLAQVMSENRGKTYSKADSRDFVALQTILVETVVSSPPSCFAS